MRYRENPNHLVPDEIRNVISKDLQIHTPIAFGAKAGRFGLLTNPTNGRADFFLQLQTQSPFDLLVVNNRFGQFLLCLMQDFDPDAGNCLSNRSKTSLKSLDRARPAFTSSMRLQISCSQAASASGEKSQVSSDRSKRMRASVRRWGGGNSRASLANSEIGFIRAKLRSAHNLSSRYSIQVY